MTGSDRFPVIAVNMKTNETRYFESESKAAMELGVDRPTVVSILRKRPHRYTIHEWTFYYDVYNYPEVATKLRLDKQYGNNIRNRSREG